MMHSGQEEATFQDNSSNNAGPSRNLSPSRQTTSGSASDNEASERPVREKLQMASLASMSELSNHPIERSRENADAPNAMTGAIETVPVPEITRKDGSRGRLKKQRSLDQIGSADEDRRVLSRVGAEYTCHVREIPQEFHAGVPIRSDDNPALASPLHEEPVDEPDRSREDRASPGTSISGLKGADSLKTEDDDSVGYSNKIGSPIQGRAFQPEQDRRAETNVGLEQEIGDGTTSPRKKRSRDQLDSDLDREQKIVATEELRAQRLSSELDRSDVTGFAEKITLPVKTSGLIQWQNVEQSERLKVSSLSIVPLDRMI